MRKYLIEKKFPGLKNMLSSFPGALEGFNEVINGTIVIEAMTDEELSGLYGSMLEYKMAEAILKVGYVPLKVGISKSERK